jgi:hypothetical protein
MQEQIKLLSWLPQAHAKNAKLMSRKHAAELAATMGNILPSKIPTCSRSQIAHSTQPSFP